MSQNANKCYLLLRKPGKNIAFHLQCAFKIIQFPVVKSQRPTIPSDKVDISAHRFFFQKPALMSPMKVTGLAVLTVK